MTEPAETEHDFYEVPKAFQERLLRFLNKSSGEHLVGLQISIASPEAFYVTVVGEGRPSYGVRLEDALNDALGSRASRKVMSRDFEKRVHDWLTRERATLSLTAMGDDFVVTINAARGSATAADRDLEVAMVFAEDELDTQVAQGEFESPALPPHELSENAPPARGHARQRPTYEHPQSAGRIIEREEARTRREERPFDPEARRERYARPHHFAVNERRQRGIYAGTAAAEDDYVVYRHGSSGYFFVDHVERGGRHTMVGYARGYEDIEHALEEAAKDAHQRGTQSAVVFVRLPDGDLHQVGSTLPARHMGRFKNQPRFEWSGRGDEERRRREGLAWLERRFTPAMRANTEAYERRGSPPPRHPAREDILREVMLGDTGFRLMTWDTHRQSRGKHMLGYAFSAPWHETLFVGEDFGASPMHAIDSDETLRALLGFLTLRPGDTDREHFASYTEGQMRFAEENAEELSMFAMEPDEGFEPPPLVDVA